MPQINPKSGPFDFGFSILYLPVSSLKSKVADAPEPPKSPLWIDITGQIQNLKSKI